MAPRTTKDTDEGAIPRAPNWGLNQKTFPTPRNNGPETLAEQDFRSAVDQWQLCVSHLPFQIAVFTVDSLIGPAMVLYVCVDR